MTPAKVIGKKKGPTPPAPQNQMRRAKFFFKTKEDPHAKAELLKIAILRGQAEYNRPKSKKTIRNVLKPADKPTTGTA